MTRMVSPFDPGKKAIIELIRQPLYDEQALINTSISVTFFQTGFAGRDFRQTNLETQGLLPVPKFFVIDGFRIVFTENKTHADKIVDLCGELLLPGLINAHHHLYSALVGRLAWPPQPTDFTEI